ncbi:hypothetical protein VAZ01S_145_00020 [Vibrio azureus NBRC 104587]|uniref:Uncharacterized protein n=1 Tax=Vibrio azureus NBRC 104587 TaxID=1219077 RepID=U3AWS5_9VIBR|nr:hypothetical protein VAZ01S_145_00020 [Vibrio azureus NBRC 104587]
MLNDNLRQHFFNSSFSKYYPTLTNEEVDTLLIMQLGVAKECLDNYGYCEHVLYSMRISAEIKYREKQTPFTKATFDYLDSAYSQLTSHEDIFTALTIPLSFVNTRLELIRQAQYKRILLENMQFTPIEFQGVNRVLLKNIQDNQDLRYLNNEFGESLDFNNPLSSAYKEFLMGVLRMNIKNETGKFTSAMLMLFQDIFSDIVNNKKDSPACNNCTTRFIVEHYNAQSEEKWYDEVNAFDFTLFGVSSIIELPSHRIIFPAKYNSEIIDFLLKYRIFYNENADIFDVNTNSLGELKPIDREFILQDLGQFVYNKAVTPNIRQIFNTTIKVLTTVNQLDKLSESVVAMRGIVSDQFKVANYSKTFALKTAITSVLSKIPKVLIGEIQRHGCNSDAWAPPQPFYILLEDLCVFTPSFIDKSFPITVSKTYGEQDKYPYEIAIFHKPTNQTLTTNIVSKGEQLNLKRSSVIAFNLNEMVLYITNTNPEKHDAIAIIELSEDMFKLQYGGVIKKNKFHFVRKLDEPTFNPYREEKFGCPLYRNTSQEQQKCLLNKLKIYTKLPDYFYKNMEQVAEIAPMYPTSLMTILRQQEEEQQRLRIQELQNAMSGVSWGPGMSGL